MLIDKYLRKYWEETMLSNMPIVILSRKEEQQQRVGYVKEWNYKQIFESMATFESNAKISNNTNYKKKTWPTI